MFQTYNEDFWKAIDTLVASGTIIIDRPKGSIHPRFPHIKYEVDYGYIDNTASMDGDGIDVFGISEGKNQRHQRKFLKNFCLLLVSWCFREYGELQ